jgi:hypothetical protein
MASRSFGNPPSGVIPEHWPSPRCRTLKALSKRRPGRNPSTDSRALLALREICTRLGYCDALYEQEAIFADPPEDADAFVDAVLRAEGQDPSLTLREQRGQILEIVTKWAVYHDRPGSDPLSNRPRFPSVP